MGGVLSLGGLGVVVEMMGWAKWVAWLMWWCEWCGMYVV